ncbi:flagellar type III secretion system pore protein FliP [Catenovulum sediminis]|uniref:flagellar type III secretion system pore protein FliP n=1 Tax=Catenovulum sediminis TaxID=1740262 RepID=UPI00117EC8D9|nr:flagellar type III secretion system pore protein FliP [Catenovulum sediminis]
MNFDIARYSNEIELFVFISALSFIPFFLIAATTFTRNIVVLSFLRHALGLQQSPPNAILITLALFLTVFTMKPVLNQSYQQGIQPYLAEQLSPEIALGKAWQPFKQFMLKEVHEEELSLVYRISDAQIPATAEEVEATELIPAFLLSELKTAFKIGFVIFLPFLLIDLLVSAILMSLGMIMVPPITISLPIKIMLFVVIDGWTLIAETLVRSAL